MTAKLIKVMLVEDDLGDAFWIKELLEAEGRPSYRFELQHFSYLHEALKYLVAESLDVVLLDLGLPDSQGMQTLRSIIEVGPNLPIVVLTGLADEEFGAAAVQKGAQDYLIKGQFNQDQLLRSLRYSLERKQAEVALRRLSEELEQRVRERTAELRGTVAQLQNEVTQRQVAEKAVRESEERLRYLASQILTAQDQERKRIAMELHEGLGQSMTALTIYLRAIRRHLPLETVRLKEDFDGARKLLIEMIEEVRRIAQGLSPAILESLGLNAALKHLLDKFSKYQDLTIRVDIDDIQKLFSPQTEINLFRIFQESLNNIAKHAQATQVSVIIKRQDGRVKFLIKDNGVGFDLEQITHKEVADKGMGLSALDERLRMIEAQLNILSQKGKGTEISFSIPFDAK